MAEYMIVDDARHLTSIGGLDPVKTYSVDEVPLAYERLHAGKINGRAVILPNG